MQDLKRLLNDSWNFFSANLFSISLILLPGMIAMNILGVMIEATFEASSDSGHYDLSTFWYAPVMVVLYALYHGALVFYIVSAVQGEPDKIGSCYQKSLVRLPNLVLLHLISGLAILTGMIFLVIPGIILIIRLQFSDFYCLIKGQGPTASFRQSMASTRSDRWLIFWGLSIIYAAVFGSTMLINVLLENLSLWNQTVSVLLSCVEGILLSLLTIFAYRMFVRFEQLSESEYMDKTE